MFDFLSKSIVFRLNTIILTLLTLSLLIFAFLVGAYNSNRTSDELQQKAINTAELASIALQYPIWTLDKEALDNSILAIMLDKDVVAIQVLGEENELVALKKRDFVGHMRLKDFKNKESYIYQVAPIQVEGIDIGEVHIATSKAKKSELNRITFFITLTFAFVITLIIGVFITVTSNAIIRDPINHLKESADKLAQGNLDHKIDVSRKDQLGSLAKSFANMQEAIREKIQSLNGEIEKRKRAEANQSRLVAIIEATPTVVAISGLKGNNLYLNRAGRRIIGYSESADLSQIKNSAFHPKWASKLIEEEGLPTAAKNNFWNGETELLKRNGQITPVDQIIIAHKDEKTGKTESFSTIMRDITDQKRHERLLQRYNRELTLTVEKRTLDYKEKNQELEMSLHKVQLMQNKLLIQEKLASLGTVTAGIAHEIKNPLNFINNFSEISVERLHDLQGMIETQREFFKKEDWEDIEEEFSGLIHAIQIINKHGKRADGIIKSMLLHSRGQKAERLPTDLNKLIGEYLGLSYHGIRSKYQMQVNLENNFDETIGVIDLFPQDLGRVFLNIFNNGFDALYEKYRDNKDSAQATLWVKTVNFDDKVEIHIRDNGLGIPDDVLSEIFYPFFTTKPTGQGTGLGLSISHKIIVQEHQGDIKVNTKPGEFTEFVITLPKNLGSKGRLARPTSPPPIQR